MKYNINTGLKKARTKTQRVVMGITALSIPAVIAVSGGVALAGNSGNGSEYHPQGSACGQYHGAFGYFGKDNNLAGGADGQATGDANSAKGCQNNL